MLATILATLAVAAPTPVPLPAEQSHWQRAGCGKPVPRAEYLRALRKVYRFSHRGGDFRAHPLEGRLQLENGRACAYTERAHRRMQRFTQRRAAKWRWHRHIDQITPYGKWAIEPAIVACESGGAWWASNPSGALGPYQLLGKGAPWPANTASRRATHHVIAAGLWQGGAGRSHWAQCL